MATAKAVLDTRLTTLKAAIVADATANGFFTAGDAYSLLAWCNALAAPAAAAWSLAANARDLHIAAQYTVYDALTQGKRDEWDMFLAFPPIDMTLAKNRNVVVDVWGGTPANSNNILTAGTRSITNAEKALGGSSSLTTGGVSAIKLTWEGKISTAEVNAIISS